MLYFLCTADILRAEFCAKIQTDADFPLRLSD